MLDMEEDEKIPLIFVRHFLAIGRAQIDVQEGKLTMRVEHEEVTFEVYKAMDSLSRVQSCSQNDDLK